MEAASARLGVVMHHGSSSRTEKLLLAINHALAAMGTRCMHNSPDIVLIDLKNYSAVHCPRGAIHAHWHIYS